MVEHGGINSEDDLAALAEHAAGASATPLLLQQLIAVEDASGAEFSQRIAALVEQKARDYEAALTPL